MSSQAGTVATPMPSGSPWFPFGTRPDASIRLLCLPHAGAGAGVYRAWSAGLPGWVAACPVQPPGREKRRAEPPVTSAREIARQLAPEIIDRVRQPYALFGHSTGALLAFEVGREVRRLGGALPVHLFVAGRRAPANPMIRTPLAGLPADQLATALRTMGGTPEDVLADPQLLELLQPLLVADFQVNEVYEYRPEPVLALPITAFASTRDHFADPEQVDGWRRETSARFQRLVLDGGHFAIFDHAPAVLGRIADDLAPWS
jgi:medium-chain acyl-[acyl-carrier-protein] hydrolase